jgi:hypothetical protein
VADVEIDDEADVAPREEAVTSEAGVDTATSDRR